MFITDRLGNFINEGDFILYATKTEAPSLQFAWVETIKQGKHGDVAVKITHSEPNGTVKTKTVFDYDPIAKTGENRDTGKPSTSTLRVYGDGTNPDSRLLAFKPI